MDPPQESLSRLPDGIPGPRFVLPLDRVPPGSPLGRYLDQDRPIRGVGDRWTGYGNIAR